MLSITSQRCYTLGDARLIRTNMLLDVLAAKPDRELALGLEPDGLATLLAGLRQVYIAVGIERVACQIRRQ